MKLIGDKLFLEFAEMVQCGVSDNYLSKARSTGIKSIKFIDDPDDLRRVLIEYETLNNKYKELIQQRFGNPYDYISKEPIRQLVTKDLEAEKYYLSYKFENGSNLPIDTVHKYTKACGWLNMLLTLEQDKSAIKKRLKISLASLYTIVVEIFKADDIPLPKKYQNLRSRMAEYKSGGYESLIEKWRFNNSFAAKIKDEVSESVLLELIASNSQHDDVVIARTYNKWAIENGYKTITDGTVGNHRRTNEYQLQLYRDGNKVWYNNYGKHILRKRPSSPLLLVGGDGNDWDMFFKSERKGQVYYFEKFVLVLVMDAFNDYVLGWSIGKEENIQLIQAAWFDALQHIKELTGNYFLPHQLQTDRFANASMKEYYSKMVADYHPAAAKSPRGKYIERAFGTSWHQTLRQYKNYSGHNITAKSKINTDRIAIEKKNFPDANEAFNYAVDFIGQLRNLPASEGLTKKQQWIQAFEQSPLSQQRQISYQQFLTNFGTCNPNTQTITNKGLVFELNNTAYHFEIPHEYYLQTVGKKIQVIYDPYCMDSVLVTDGDKIRFMASVPYYLPSAKADQLPGDDSRFWKRLHQKKQHLEEISAAKKQRESILYENGINPEALLQAGILVKGIKQQAEAAMNDAIYLPAQPQEPDIYNPVDQM